MEENEEKLTTYKPYKRKPKQELLLCFDLSTTCSGWALFDVNTKALLDCGVIKGSEKGLSKLIYPKRQLAKMEMISDKLENIVKSIDPDFIAIEEINLGKNRLGQKTLDGLHWVFLQRIRDHRAKIIYKDSDGKTGWRKDLNHNLTKLDKEKNKEIRTFNKKVKKDQQKSVITKKHITARWVNATFKRNFDVDKVAYHADICDAIGCGFAVVQTLKM